MDEKPQQFPSNIQIHNYDLSSLFIETRGWICKLISDMSQKNAGIVKTYQNAFYYFIQLFEASRHMIRKSGKIDDWNDKEKLYFKFIKRIEDQEYLPQLMIEHWRFLSDDIVQAGLYDNTDYKEIKTIVKMMKN